MIISKEKRKLFYSSEEEEYIDKLVFAYQAGDKKAIDELMHRFGCHPSYQKPKAFVGKYYRMLRYGKINFSDKDSRKFLTRFMKDPAIRKAMGQWFQYGETKEEAMRALQLASNVLKQVPDEDFQQDLRLLFLERAIRYDKIKKRVAFQGYLYNSYRHAVGNYIAKLMKEPLLFSHIKRVNNDYVVDKNGFIEIDDSIFKDTPIIAEDDKLGNSWVRGLTCTEEYRGLTHLQRLILKLYYEDGYTDGELADKMGMHINTVFRHRKRAMEKVKQKRLEMIKEGLV